MALLLLLYLSYIFIAIVTYLSTNYLWSKLLKRPPSPFLCLPLIGHLYVDTHPITESYAKLANRLGPILFLWTGLRPTIVVSSPSLVEECLGQQNDVVFANRPRGTLLGKYRGYEFTSMSFAPYGPHWRNLRKVATVEMLSSHRLHLLADIRADEVRLLIRRLLSRASNNNKLAEMRPQIFDTNLNIMTRMIFGESYYGLEGSTGYPVRLREFVVEAIALANLPVIGDDIPCLRWLERDADKRFRRYTQERDKLMMELVDEYRGKSKVTELNNVETKVVKVKPMIQSLLELQQSEPEYYTDQMIHSIIGDLLVGSSETSANVLEWSLSLLLNHPQILKKVRTEIDNHVGYERLLQEPDLNHLPYLRCLLSETLRMYPPLPFLFPHASSKDCVVGGYRVQRGTFLVVNIHAIQNDPKLWDDPKVCRPERFQGADGHKIGYKMMPFGSGRRSCPGEGLATRVLGMVLGTLIQCLDLERVDDKPLDMTLLESNNLQKAVPLIARVQPRQPMIHLLRQL